MKKHQNTKLAKKAQQDVAPIQKQDATLDPKQDAKGRAIIEQDLKQFRHDLAEQVSIIEADALNRISKLIVGETAESPEQIIAKPDPKSEIPTAQEDPTPDSKSDTITPKDETASAEKYATQNPKQDETQDSKVKLDTEPNLQHELSSAQSTSNGKGLTKQEVQTALLKYGKNIVEEKKKNKLLMFFLKFWAPVPWMLEITIILQIVLHKYEEAIIITILLLFNAILSFFQENHADKALDLLKRHLAIQARVFRDALWQLISAEDLVPGDLVHLRMGDIAPADICLNEGEILIDQSILTGEALPVEGKAGSIVYSGAIIKRGEATGEIKATGQNTFFGKTAVLVKNAKAESQIQKIIFNIVKYLVLIDVFFIVCVVIYALITHLALINLLPFILILLVAAIPAALPATITLATAIGATQLAKQGVLVTHLTAIEEAASMDIVCLDKTGTITQNKLELAQMITFDKYTEEQLLLFSALASDESTQDPIDQAIFAALNKRNLSGSIPKRIQFTPFDPANKRSEALFKQNGKEVRVLKGAPDTITSLIPNAPDLSKAVTAMANKSYRVLVVVIEMDGKYKTVGLLGLYDPPRIDSKQLLQNLKTLLGLRIQMVTGDGIATAKAIAKLVGIGNKVCSTQILKTEIKKHELLNYDVFADMFPENKFQLVKALQKDQHIVGMTGDGVNDAPALKQAEVGIAVANATDVAKAAASIVLMQPGLNGLRLAIEVSRYIYQRMQTYTLNKIIKTIEITIFLSLGFIFSGDLVLTPVLMVLLMFTNDFVTMSIATDNAVYSHQPERWQISKLMLAGGMIASLILILSFSMLYYVHHVLHLPLAQLQTFIFVMLVTTGQGLVYLVRERNHFWSSMPGRWLILSSVLDILVVSILATQGILMAAIKPALIAELILVIIFYLSIIDFLKIRIFKFLNIHV